jgi:hypothetical protein
MSGPEKRHVPFAGQFQLSDLVGEADLSNAVALNSTSFNAVRVIGPAVAGVLIASVGSGWVFLINAASFAAVLCSLCLRPVHRLSLAVVLRHRWEHSTTGLRVTTGS